MRIGTGRHETTQLASILTQHERMDLHSASPGVGSREWLRGVKSLYKYRDAGNSDHIESLRANAIWFAAPSEFNDPFDLGIPWRYHSEPDEVIRKGFQIMKDRDPVIAQYSEQQVAARSSQFIVNLPNDQYQRLSLDRELHRKEMLRYRIFSASQERNHTLMWSHYSDGHKGFVIEYNAERLLDFIASTPLRVLGRVQSDFVKYAKMFPSINPYVENSDLRDLSDLTFYLKHQDWAYEKEFRIALGPFDHSSREKGLLVSLEEGIVDSICFGLRMEEEQKSLLREAVSAWTKKPKFFQARYSDLSFEPELVYLDN
jgi:hypothetical protein